MLKPTKGSRHPVPSLKQLGADAYTFLGAGTDTTANTLVIAIYNLLAGDPKMLARLKAELREALPDKATIGTWAQLEDLPYLVSGVALDIASQPSNARVQDAHKRSEGRDQGKPPIIQRCARQTTSRGSEDRCQVLWPRYRSGGASISSRTTMCGTYAVKITLESSKHKHILEGDVILQRQVPFDLDLFRLLLYL